MLLHAIVLSPRREGRGETSRCAKCAASNGQRLHAGRLSRRRPRECIKYKRVPSSDCTNKARLQTPTPPTTLLPGRVTGNGRHILDPTNLHARTRERTERRLAAWSGLFGAGPAGSAEFNVEGGDTDFFAFDRYVLGGQHGSVGLQVSMRTSDPPVTIAFVGRGMTRLTEDSSRSALTFMPPVTREMVSLPERSVTWTKVSLKLLHQYSAFLREAGESGCHAPSVNVSNAKDELAICDLRSDDGSFLLGLLDLLWWLDVSCRLYVECCCQRGTHHGG